MGFLSARRQAGTLPCAVHALTSRLLQVALRHVVLARRGLLVGLRSKHLAPSLGTSCCGYIECFWLGNRRPCCGNFHWSTFATQATHCLERARPFLPQSRCFPLDGTYWDLLLRGRGSQLRFVTALAASRRASGVPNLAFQLHRTKNSIDFPKLKQRKLANHWHYLAVLLVAVARGFACERLYVARIDPRRHESKGFAAFRRSEKSGTI